MAEGVEIPGLGHISKGMLGAIAIGGAGIVFLLYRQHQNNAAANAAQSSGIDPATGYPYGSSQDQAALASGSTLQTGNTGAIDPSTGLPYGSPEDQAALAQMYSGLGGYGGLVDTGVGTGSSPYTPSTTGTSGQITTNAEWDQQALSNLESLGYNEQAAATALALYLAHMNLTQEQATMVQIAVAETGPPPTGSYAIQTGTGGSGGPPTGTQPGGPASGVSPGGPATGTQVKVPDVSRMRVEDANSALSAAGLTSRLSEQRKPGVAYYVLSQTPGAGQKVNRGTTVDLHISPRKPPGIMS